MSFEWHMVQAHIKLRTLLIWFQKFISDFKEVPMIPSDFRLKRFAMVRELWVDLTLALNHV